jgi:hypothetical protein
MRSAWCLFVGQALLVLIMEVLFIAKAAEFGLGETLAHVSNWAWQAAALFYALLLPAIDERALPFVNVVVVVGWLPLATIIAYVAVVVAALLLESPAFIVELFGVYDAGDVIVGNEVLHFVPLLVFAAVSTARRALIFNALYRAFTSPALRADGLSFVGLVLYEVWFGAGAFFLVYILYLAATGSSPMQVYEESAIEYGRGSMLFLLVAALVAGSFLLACTHCAGVCTRRTADEEALFVRRIYETDFERELDEYKAARRRPDTTLPYALEAATRAGAAARTGPVAPRRHWPTTTPQRPMSM